MLFTLTWIKNTVLLVTLLGFSCGKKINKTPIQTEPVVKATTTKTKDIILGANRLYAYLPQLKGQRVGIVANQTSVIYKPNGTNVHLVDSLLQHKVAIKKVFAPEHGFRGKQDAGEVVKNGIDTKTKLPIISLYGKNKKPKVEQLKDIDVVIFDIQDVGARFYTYISSLHYVMEACAEQGKKVIVLDRPNPNGHIIDGPTLNPTYKSFVGMHPIPVLHGMTIGEYAQMINGEKWLKKGVTCNLEVIKMAYYNHNKEYALPIKPSPNLPNAQSINLYASLCFFEGTTISVGRGTNKQFQVYGAPTLPKTTFSFIPKPNDGAKYPKHENKVCYGKDLSKSPKLNELKLDYLIDAYNSTNNKENFFLKNSFINKLAGTNKLKAQIEKGFTAKEIKQTWQVGLNKFKTTRAKYLLYK